MLNTQAILFLLIGVVFFKVGESHKADIVPEEIRLHENHQPRSSECSISIQDNNFVKPQPIFIVNGTEEFWIPGPDGILKIPTGKEIEMFCGKRFKGPLSEKTLITAICMGGTNFTVEGKQFSFSDFVCTENSNHTARRIGECYNGAVKIKVGYEIGTRFLKTFEVCFDEANEATLFVHHKLNPSSNAFQKPSAESQFIQGDFFAGKNVNELYKQIKSKETIGKILSGGHEKYFDKNSFLSRGHISARADYIFRAQQGTTFYYINAAPQWQRINDGNWEKIERGVRKFVADKKIEVDCYSGSWGVSELPDINKNPQKLYLSVDQNNKTQIPVPKIFYRIVVEPATKKGIVLITVNNPHIPLDLIKGEYQICPDLSDKVNWIEWKKDDIPSGYSYACEVNEFLKKVPYVPNLDVTGLLSSAPASVIRWGFSKLLIIIIFVQISTKLYL